MKKYQLNKNPKKKLYLWRNSCHLMMQFKVSLGIVGSYLRLALLPTMRLTSKAGLLINAKRRNNIQQLESILTFLNFSFNMVFMSSNITKNSSLSLQLLTICFLFRNLLMNYCLPNHQIQAYSGSPFFKSHMQSCIMHTPT